MVYISHSQGKVDQVENVLQNLQMKLMYRNPYKKIMNTWAIDTLKVISTFPTVDAKQGD